MNYTTLFHTLAQKTRASIAIGIDNNLAQFMQIQTAVEHFLTSTSNHIIYVGSPEIINQIQDYIPKTVRHRQINFLPSLSPSDTLLQILYEPNTIPNLTFSPHYPIQGIVRGQLSSATFLTAIRKMQLQHSKQTPSNLPSSPAPIYRLALLETAQGFQFFYGGVGIDEVNSYHDKLAFIEYAIRFFNIVNISPRIAILSGGRLGDKGRDLRVDQTIQEADLLTETLKSKYPEIWVQHQQILIEEAIQQQSNLIIPPDGIAGNLIYRTLIHLGAGKSYGALYLPSFFNERKIMIDCSRVAPTFEIEGSLFFAAAMIHLQHPKGSA